MSFRCTKVGKKVCRGFLVHSSICASLSGLALGVLEQSCFTYEDYREKQGRTDVKTKHNKNHPIEQKKSFRWIEHFKSTAIQFRKLDQKVVQLADREADIFESLAEINDSHDSFVIRSSMNRRTNYNSPDFCAKITSEASKQSKTHYSRRCIRDSKTRWFSCQKKQSPTWNDLHLERVVQNQ